MGIVGIIKTINKTWFKEQILRPICLEEDGRNKVFVF